MTLPPSALTSPLRDAGQRKHRCDDPAHPNIKSVSGLVTINPSSRYQLWMPTPVQQVIFHNAAR